MSFEEELKAGAAESGLALAPRVLDACGAHFHLLVTWNRTHNLTRITEVGEAVRLHYLDCLLPLAGWEAPRSFVDVGSGAGFPGLLAALCWPEAEGALVEPAKKRSSFLELAAAEMGLGQLRVVAPEERPQGARVLSRATFPPGRRRELLAYGLAGAEVAVWGHPHDLATWAKEVSTWGWTPQPARDYRVAGVEPRCLLRAAAS